MTTKTAVKFLEVMSDLHPAVATFCLNHGYAWNDIVYGAFGYQVLPKTARTAVCECRKIFNFTRSDYNYWFKNYSAVYGEVWQNTRI